VSTTTAGLAELTTMIGAPVIAGEPLARHSSWRVGGRADYFVRANSVAVLKQAVLTARARALPYTIIGRGTNILVADAGVRGLVIAADCDGYMLIEREDTALLSAEAGASLPMLANSLARAGWAGLEWAVGVPSAIGSAVVNNCGAHGACIADSIVRAVILDAAGGEASVDGGDMHFAYRHSRFKGQGEPREVILSAELLLRREDSIAILGRARKYNEHRRRTQPSDPSAGSVFQNPPDDFAGRLLEAADLKGTSIGGATISMVHANFFVNTGTASAADLFALIRVARARVCERFGVQLEPEIEFVGDWGQAFA
jgi:UDP-N-acetylmuramate dehydrogenase